MTMKFIYAVIALIIAAFLYWTISPLFIENVVEEEVAVDLSQFNDVSDRDDVVIKKDSESTSQTVDRDSFVQETPDRQRDVVVQQPKPQPVVRKPETFQGAFRDADASHKASGEVYIAGNALSLVNFDSTNVPDGFVYLSNGLDVDDSVRLAKLKGNKGNQNYTIPSGVDASDYSHVLIWCRAFSVLVGSAEIN